MLSTEQEKNLSEIVKFVKEKSGYRIFSSDNALKDISNLYKASKNNNIKISALKIKETSLEEVFIHLIKEDLSNMEEIDNK